MTEPTSPETITLQDETDKYIDQVQKAIVIAADDTVSSIVLKIMQEVENVAHDCKGAAKKIIVSKVISRLDVSSEMKQAIELIIVNGVLSSMIDGFVDVAKKRVILQKEQVIEKTEEAIHVAADTIKKGCCTIQ